MIECHFQTWGREVAWQGCDPLRSLSLQPLRRTELDKNWKWMQPLCSFSRRWIFVWADQTAALCPRRSRTGGTTQAHFPEQKRIHPLQREHIIWISSGNHMGFPNERKWQTSWVLMMGEKTEYSAQRSSNSLVRTSPNRPLPAHTWGLRIGKIIETALICIIKTLCVFVNLVFWSSV